MGEDQEKGRSTMPAGNGQWLPLEHRTAVNGERRR